MSWSAGVSLAFVRPVANLLWREPFKESLPTGSPTKLLQLQNMKDARQNQLLAVLLIYMGISGLSD